MGVVRFATCIAMIALCAFGQHAGAAELTIACGSDRDSVNDCRMRTREWSMRTGHSVRLYIAPPSSTSQFPIFEKFLQEKSSEIDVFMVDLIWPAVLAPHLLDLRKYSKGREKEHFPVIVANNTVGGKLLAMPWFTDVGLMYYRQDLLAKYKLPVPRTWAAMASAARLIQDGERKDGNAAMTGFVFQGKPYEGLTCNALEWIASHGGGTFMDGKGNITVNNPRAAQALDAAASWREIVHPDVLGFKEADARNVFGDGHAVFMRNWAHSWRTAQSEDSPVRGKIGMAPLPRGPEGNHVGTFGGWQLAVSAYSAHPALAADLVMFLTSKDAQKRRAISLGTLPTYPVLYKDADLLQAAPHLSIVADALKTAVARPSGIASENYRAMSTAVWSAASAVLSGRANGTAAVKQLDKELTKIRNGMRG